MLLTIAEKEMMSAISQMSSAARDDKQQRDKVAWMIYERIFYILLFLGYLVLGCLNRP
jgi:hypothetical protein